MKWVFAMFIALYLAALVLFAVGTFGWFGQEQDPLSGVFLLPLGLPWNFLGSRLGLEGAWLPLAAPALNAGLLYWLSRKLPW